MLSLYVFYLQARHTSTEARSSYSYTWDRDDWPLTIDVSWKTARLAARDYSYTRSRSGPI